MRIRFLFPLLLLTTALLSGFGWSTKTAPESAVVDTARILRESVPGKAGVKFLENLHETMQTELNSLQEQSQKNPEDVSIQEKFQTAYMNYQQRMNAAQQHVLTLLNDAMLRTVENIREQRGLAVVISSDATLSYSKTVDITDAVIEQLNTQQLEFKETLPPSAELPEGQTASESDTQTSGQTPATQKEPAPARNSSEQH